MSKKNKNVTKVADALADRNKNRSGEFKNIEFNTSKHMNLKTEQDAMSSTEDQDERAKKDKDNNIPIHR